MKWMLLGILLTATSVNALAQDRQRQRINREQLAQKQADYIAQQLALDGDTKQQFTQTYLAFQQEVWNLGPRLKTNSAAAQNDEAAEAAIKQRFERSQKLLDLREKYYQKYSKFLTQKQIQEVYKLERQMMRRLAGKGRGAQGGKRGSK